MLEVGASNAVASPRRGESGEHGRMSYPIQRQAAPYSATFASTTIEDVHNALLTANAELAVPIEALNRRALLDAAVAEFRWRGSMPSVERSPKKAAR
jgi:hypothetical protein